MLVEGWAVWDSHENSPVSPESLDLAVRHNHACERYKRHDHKWVDERCEDSVGRIRCDGLSDSCVEELVHHL